MPEEAKTIIIGNPEDLSPPHVCTSIDSIHKIEINIAEIKGSILNMAAMIQEHNAQMEERMRRQDQIIDELGVRVHTVEIGCNREERWENTRQMVTSLSTDILAMKQEILAIRRDVDTHHTEAATTKSIYEPYKGVIFAVVSGSLILVIGGLLAYIGFHQ